jgi:hypothetical protein
MYRDWEPSSELADGVATWTRAIGNPSMLKGSLALAIATPAAALRVGP